MMHKLLSRLVARNLPSNTDMESVGPFLASVNEAFDQNDRDRALLERSLNLVSEELTDINNRLRDKLKALSVSQQMLKENLTEQISVINAIPEAIFNLSPDGDVKYVNKSACEFLGVSECEIKRKSGENSYSLILDMLVAPEKFLCLLEKIRNNELLSVSDDFETLDGRHFDFRTEPGFLDGKYINRVWYFRDVTQSREVQEQLKFQAFYDSLTNLPNRTLIFKTLDHAIEIANRNSAQLAVLFIDIDDFKTINDTSGHDVGDRLLVSVAKKISSELRCSDTIGRLGGDEFLVILEGVKQLTSVASVVERILKVFATSFNVGANDFYVTCSIGISTCPNDGVATEVLVRKADMAMYKAKKMGKNRLHYFDDALEQDALYRLSIESDLRKAIDINEFVFHYQPKVSFNSGRIVGVEALIRWLKPSGELVYPDTFIDVAEQTGLIRSITRLVVTSACEKIAIWKGSPLANLPISVNVSTMDFVDEGFIDHLLKEMDRCKIQPGMIELEITESVFLGDMNKAIGYIERIKPKGVLLSVDDFGTGYSSFGYLNDLNIDYLKIDKQFVFGLNHNKKSRAIVKSIVDLGVNLGFKVIAEGVETKEDHDFLHGIGCHIGQGFYYSKPIDETSLNALINTSSQLTAGM